MVSSELPELLGMSDRILVMRNGSIAGELPAGAGIAYQCVPVMVVTCGAGEV